jgi:phosphate:Na+ symporter
MRRPSFIFPAMIWIKWLLSVLGGLGVFLFGMRTLSDAIRRVSATSFRQFLSSITQSTWVGTMTGLFVTSLLQSSSAVTVTLVSLVNAGLLTIRESVGVLFGANIGTTITAWLIVLSLGGFSLSDMALPIAGLAVPLLLMERRLPRQVANMMIGFALLFIGLGLLKGQMESVGARDLFTSIFPDGRGGFGHNVLFLLIGATLTALIQSSSAATALTLAAMVSGLIGLESALAMVLGENVGTTLTANLAAVVGNRAAKRVARIHFLINALGAVWMIGLVPVMADILSNVFSAAESEDVRNGYALAMFHTAFNVLNGLVMGLFIDPLVKLSKRLVWVEDMEGESHTPIPGRIVDARLSLEEVQNDFRRSASLLKRMAQGVEDLFGILEPADRTDVLNHVSKWEERTDRIEQTINAKLSGVAQQELSPELSGRLAALSAINPDFERVGDMLLNMAWQLEAKEREGVYFMPRQRSNVLQMLGLLKEAIDVMDNQLKSTTVDLDAVAEVEGKINALRDRLREKHLKDVERGRYPASSGVLYNELITSLEECGDRVAHVSAQLSGTWGEED